MAFKNVLVSTVFTLLPLTVTPPSTREDRSFVIIPSSIVSKAALYMLEAKETRAGISSSSPLFLKAPVQAKMVAIGFVEVTSPFR